jgi:fumarate hydratase subunit alpha
MKIRKIKVSQISKVVSGLCIEANLKLRKDVLTALKRSLKQETLPRAKNILKSLIKNASLASREKIPLCQDTGLAVVFVDLGQDVHIIDGDLTKAINQGVALGYQKGYLRSSVIEDPLIRKNSKDSPAVVHFNLVKGNKIRITVLPKGFGCENVGQVKMFCPTENIEKVKEFVINTVKVAGPNACPPFIVGVGIGGTQDYACLLAKRALLRKLKTQNAKRKTKSESSKIEEQLLIAVNKLNLGPMGLGGKTTALGVNILTYPTHIAGLPVAVNISCHSLRSATKKL